MESKLCNGLFHDAECIWGYTPVHYMVVGKQRIVNHLGECNRSLIEIQYRTEENSEQSLEISDFPATIRMQFHATPAWLACWLANKVWNVENKWNGVKERNIKEGNSWVEREERTNREAKEKGRKLIAER
jgi:hypothetical protein